jgi:hypothetical protein
MEREWKKAVRKEQIAGAGGPLAVTVGRIAGPEADPNFGLLALDVSMPDGDVSMHHGCDSEAEIERPLFAAQRANTSVSLVVPSGWQKQGALRRMLERSLIRFTRALLPRRTPR